MNSSEILSAIQELSFKVGDFCETIENCEFCPLRESRTYCVKTHLEDALFVMKRNGVYGITLKARPENDSE